MEPTPVVPCHHVAEARGSLEALANDIEIVFNAAKYEGILVTADGGSRRQLGGILGNRAALSM